MDYLLIVDFILSIILFIWVYSHVTQNNLEAHQVKPLHIKDIKLSVDLPQPKTESIGDVLSPKTSYGIPCFEDSDSEKDKPQKTEPKSEKPGKVYRHDPEEYQKIKKAAAKVVKSGKKLKKALTKSKKRVR